MNKKYKEQFEKYLEIRKRSENLFNAVEFANKCGYRILYPKDDTLPHEIIAVISKEDKTIYLNNFYSPEIGRFSIFYLISKAYLGKLKEAEIYTCIEIPNKEAYELAKQLLIPKTPKKEMELDQAMKKAKVLKIPFSILYKREGEEL